MQNFLKIASGVDVMPLVLALQRQPELFGRNKERQYSPDPTHREMTDVWVRMNDRKQFDESGDWSKSCDEHDSVWYPEADAIPQVRPIVFALMARVEGERLGGILITKLPPGGKLAPHIDYGWHAGYYDKYYVALHNKPGSRFSFPDGSFEAVSGDVYWFRNDVLHSVTNDSDDDRLSMIVCIRNTRARA